MATNRINRLTGLNSPDINSFVEQLRSVSEREKEAEIDHNDALLAELRSERYRLLKGSNLIGFLGKQLGLEPRRITPETIFISFGLNGGCKIHIHEQGLAKLSNLLTEGDYKSAYELVEKTIPLREEAKIVKEPHGVPRDQYNILSIDPADIDFEKLIGDEVNKRAGKANAAYTKAAEELADVTGSKKQMTIKVEGPLLDKIRQQVESEITGQQQQRDAR